MSKGNRKKVLGFDWEVAKSRALTVVTRHIGKANAIGAGEYFREVFEQDYKGNKITGTRPLRDLIEALRYDDGVFIAFNRSSTNPGYYLPNSDSERREFTRSAEIELKKRIAGRAALNRLNAAAYAGQLALEMQETQFPERA